MQLHFHFNLAAIPAPAKHRDRRRASTLRCARRPRVVVGAAGGAWLLKYIMCVIFNPQSTHIVSTFLCALSVLCGLKMKS